MNSDVAAEASLPSRATGATGNLQEDMQKLMNNLESRLVARMEEVLERNFTKYSNVLQDRKYTDFPEADRQTQAHQKVFLEMSRIAKAASQREVNQVRPEDSEQKVMLATSHPSRPQSETAREVETARKVETAGGADTAREEAKTAREMFRGFDTSHDGNISREEWMAGVRAEEVAAGQGDRRQVLGSGSGREDLETAQEVFDRLDTNHDGIVSQEEWEEGIKEEKARAQREGGVVKTLFARRKKSGPHLGHQIEAEDCLQELVQAIWFQVAVVFVIILQASFLGWEANERMQLEIEFLEGDRENADISSHFGPVSMVFTCFFALEILLRICAWRRKFFNYSDQEFFVWNLFDLFVVLGMALEFVDIDIDVLRSVRLLRVTRVLRTLRIFPKLRKMVYALLHSMVALFWLMVMLAVTLYIFSLSIMQGSLQYLKDKTPEEFQAIKPSDFAEMRGTYIILKKFGNIGLTMRSLFAAITGGDPWDWLFTPIMDQSWVYSVIVFFFVLFFVFAVMNVVTGVFVDEAMKIAQIDKDIMIQDLKAEDLLMQKDMQQLVKTLDEDGDGTLDVDELKHMLEEKEVQRWLQGCDIDLSLGNLDQILDVLDHDQTGKVNPDDFFGILSSIKGQARSVDVFLLHHEVILLQHFMAAQFNTKQR